LVDHIILVSTDADRQRMLQGRDFDDISKLWDWKMSHCKISKLPPSFGALVCSGYLILSDNTQQLLSG
jgi:hypothetical protein